MVQRVLQTSAMAINGGVKTVHSVFQSNGGLIGDGIALYNYFRAIPMDLHFYNIGSVGSIGVIAFLGGRKRYASADATFVVHKAHSGAIPPANAERARGLADALKFEDTRIRAILERHLEISADQLDRHIVTEAPFDANAALACGLIHEIREFTVPPGNQMTNI